MERHISPSTVPFRSRTRRLQSRPGTSLSVRSVSQAAKGTTTIEALNKFLCPEEPPAAKRDDHNRGTKQVSPSAAPLRRRKERPQSRPRTSFSVLRATSSRKGRPQSKPRSSISVRSVSQAAKRTTTIETSIKYLRPERSLGAEKDNHTYRG